MNIFTWNSKPQCLFPTILFSIGKHRKESIWWHNEHLFTTDFHYFPNLCSVPIWLINTEALAHHCSPSLSPTKHTETFGKSSLGFMTYSCSTGYAAPSAQQLLHCDKATHGDSEVWAYMGMWKIQKLSCNETARGLGTASDWRICITCWRACRKWEKHSLLIIKANLFE